MSVIGAKQLNEILKSPKELSPKLTSAPLPSKGLIPGTIAKTVFQTPVNCLMLKRIPTCKET